MKVWQLLSDESKWTKGCMARNGHGQPVASYDPEATCWCVVGSICQCYHSGDAINEPLYRLRKALLTIPSLSSWNDAPERTFSEVHALVKELDI